MKRLLLLFIPLVFFFGCDNEEVDNFSEIPEEILGYWKENSRTVDVLTQTTFVTHPIYGPGYTVDSESNYYYTYSPYGFLDWNPNNGDFIYYSCDSYFTFKFDATVTNTRYYSPESITEVSQGYYPSPIIYNDWEYEVNDNQIQLIPIDKEYSFLSPSSLEFPHNYIDPSLVNINFINVSDDEMILSGEYSTQTDVDDNQYDTDTYSITISLSRVSELPD